ncbi:olfactory receptor 1D2-like [Oncorhynchus clarkii lewisi]|uniref:olfactory receptor 1D2-like n=1 Tax=Oncorhynchus clarkii lewisi TaxID=490388 RepID=UPI0039B83F48
MENSTQVKLFYLFGLQETFNNKSVYFILPLITYLLIITVNLTMIITIIQEKGLHEPMYIFLCSLCVNGLYGTAGFYPKLLLDLQSDVQVISYGGCFTQAYVIYTSVMCEISTLTVMSYDRYVAICRPLLYHTIVTSLTVRKLLLFSWCCPLFIALIALSLAVRISLCGSRIDKIFCDIPSILKHACLPITINQNLNKFAEPEPMSVGFAGDSWYSVPIVARSGTSFSGIRCVLTLGSTRVEGRPRDLLSPKLWICDHWDPAQLRMSQHPLTLTVGRKHQESLHFITTCTQFSSASRGSSFITLPSPGQI